MKRTYLLTLLFIALSISTSYSQFADANSFINPYDFYHIQENNRKTKIDLATVDGSPYEQEAFVLGKAIERLTKNTKNYYLRYNVFNDEIQMKSSLSDDKIIGLIKSLYHYAIINNKEYHYMSYSDDDKNIKEGYFILISPDDKNPLYLKRIKKFKVGQPAKDSFRKAIPPAFKDFQRYYYKKDRVLFQLPTKKKDLLLLFSDKKDELKKFMKTQKTNLKNEKDLIKLFEYYNSIRN